MHLIIPVHSVIDVITNSSSEVFVTANTKTIEIVKEIINTYLKDACYAETADQLFDIELVHKGYNDNDEEIDVVGQSPYSPSRIRVTPISSVDNPKLIELAELMNKLNDAFHGSEFVT